MSSDIAPSNDDEPNVILYRTQDGKATVKLFVQDGQVWLTQNQLSDLFATSKQNVSLHIGNILKEKELEESSVVKFYLTTAQDGKRYSTKFYSLEMILALGFRVRGIRGTQFRQWAIRNLKEYLVKGFVIDDERLKNPDGRPDYFDELLARIRDIRASEKRFYQKVRDLFALSSDYDSSDKSTQMFFQEVQNKLLYAVVHHTAPEIVSMRSNVDAPNMGLTSWSGSIVRKADVYIAKNYLSNDELDSLNRLVVVFLEQAELRVKGRRDLTMAFWKTNVDRLIEFNDMPVLVDKGKVSRAEADRIAGTRYDLFDKRRKEYEARLADEDDLKRLLDVEKKIKKRGKDSKD